MILNFAVVATAVAAIPLIRAQSAAPMKLTVEASEVSGAMGTVKVSVWRDDKTFLKGEPYFVAEVEMKGGRATVTVPNLEPGEYAVSAYHDMNHNGRLDTGFAGKPTEPYGFSNDAKGRFGPPKFDQARFHLDKDKTISIHLN
jgi:uncharacterized protein (DUF2141 family)